jgi:hypothetical protein
MLKLLTLSQRLQQVADLISPTSTSINICVDGVDIYSAKCSRTRLGLTNCYNYYIQGDYQLNFMGGDNYYQLTTVPDNSFELESLIKAIENAINIEGSCSYGLGSNSYFFVSNGYWVKSRLID